MRILLLIGAGIAAFVAAIGIFIVLTPNPFPLASLTTPASIVTPSPASSIGGIRTLHGTYICLPHKNTSGPQTMECAYGLQADDGYTYALSMGDDRDQFHSGGSVTAKGLVVPLEAISSDQWAKYDIKGIMQVESLLGR